MTLTNQSYMHFLQRSIEKLYLLYEDGISVISHEIFLDSSCALLYCTTYLPTAIFCIAGVLHLTT